MNFQEQIALARELKAKADELNKRWWTAMDLALELVLPDPPYEGKEAITIEERNRRVTELSAELKKLSERSSNTMDLFFECLKPEDAK